MTTSHSLSAMLRAGLLAGAVSGLGSSVVLWAVTEPVIRRALAIEEARSEGTVPTHEDVFGRDIQVLGGVVATLFVTVLTGVLFALVFARVRHRLPGNTDTARSLALTATGFAVFALVPAVKYPANPPAVGDPATVGYRTTLYALLAGAGVAVVLLTYLAHSRATSSGWTPAARTWSVAGTLVLLTTVVLLVFPGGPDQIPADVPAALVWDFRVASLAQLLTSWTVLGLVLGTLLDRKQASHSHDHRLQPTPVR